MQESKQDARTVVAFSRNGGKCAKCIKNSIEDVQ